MSDKPVVSVCTITFNHAQFIRQCMDGVAMQIADFPVEHLVHDDASTDGTSGIVRAYAAEHPESVTAILQETNQFSRGVDILAKHVYPIARGKYVAFCEGDDYWTDPLKLRKQVDFLERNPDFSCCFGCCRVMNMESGDISEVFPEPRQIADGRDVVTRRDFLSNYRTQTMTCLFRAELAPGLMDYEHMQDIVCYSELLRHGKGKVLQDVFGVYRRHAGGVASGAAKIDFLGLQVRAGRSMYRRNRHDTQIAGFYFEALDEFLGLLASGAGAHAKRPVSAQDIELFCADYQELLGRLQNGAVALEPARKTNESHPTETTAVSRDVLEGKKTMQPSSLHFVRAVAGAGQSRRALISYIAAPFRGGPNRLHQNQVQVVVMARVLGNLGYEVDVVDYDRKLEPDYPHQYDLVVDIHPHSAEFFRRTLRPGGFKVGYLTGSNPEFSNAAERARVDSANRRRGGCLVPHRQVPDEIMFPRAVLESLDLFLLIGNETTLETYSSYALKLPTLLPNTGYEVAGLSSVPRSERRFAFIGSSGQVHKGLDLLLEFFAGRPDLELFVFSSYHGERDFHECYARELEQTANIHALGFVDLFSEDASRILSSCRFLLLPSCSEGMSGSVLTGMSFGMVPIVSRESGFPEGEVFLFPDCTPEGISRGVDVAMAASSERLDAMATANLERLRTKYSLEEYARRFHDAVVRLHDDAKSRTSTRCTTPVAFFVFNRPDYARQVFETIRQARPPRLLVVSDAPRPHVAGEAEKVAASRALVDEVDWECDVSTQFATENMGCRKRLSSGIDWIFSQVDRAIILEDDCVPHSTFYRFCDEMLERYADDERVGMISGDNFQEGRRWDDKSYYFSRINHIWGWATWARAWKKYDLGMRDWPAFLENGRLREIFPDPVLVDYWTGIMKAMHAGAIDTWDYPWMFASWNHDMLALLPSVNLVTNIGVVGTHTEEGGSSPARPMEPMEFPLRHPEVVSPLLAADFNTFLNTFHLPCRKPEDFLPAGHEQPIVFTADMAEEDPYDRAWMWGLSQPDMQELVRLCYKTPDQAFNAKSFEASPEFTSMIELLESLGKGPGRGHRVLDFGCGNAVATWALAGRGYLATGIDSSPGLLAGLGAGLSLVGFEGRDFSLHLSRGERLPYEDASFDVVVMRQVLHHITDLPAFLSEVHRILKPSGVACAFRDHVIWNESQREDFFRTHPFHHITKDENCHYLEEYLDGFRKAGFADVEAIDPLGSAINTFPGPFVPGRKLDVEEARRRPVGNDLYSFVARKGDVSSQRPRQSGRIAIDGVFFQINHTGIARVWVNLLKRWAGTPFGDRIVLFDRAGTAPSIPGIETIRIPGYDVRNIDADRRMLADLCRKTGAIRFVSTYYTAAEGIPSTFFAYDMIPENTAYYDLRAEPWITKARSIREADAYIAISRSTITDLERFHPAARGKVRLALPGLDASVFHPASPDGVARLRSSLGIGERPFFLFIGSKLHYKNAELVFQSLGRMPGASDCVLLLVGGEPDVDPRWKSACGGALVLQTRLDDDALRAAYTGAAAFLHPSLYEGFGLTILEAMACGCPVVACRNSSIPEVTGDASLLVDPDPLAFSKAMLQAMDPVRRRELVAAGMARAGMFQWSAMADGVRAALEDDCEAFALRCGSAPRSVQADRIPASAPVRTANPSRGSGEIRVTAVVSTYKSEVLIAGCLDNLLEQTLWSKGELEIVVVDTGSPQKESEIVQKYQSRYGSERLRLMRYNERQTLYWAWNAGFQAAKGRFIANTNTDDILRPDALEIMADALDAHPSAAFAFANNYWTDRIVKRWDDPDVHRVYRPFPEYHPASSLHWCTLGPHPMWRRSTFDLVGWFDPAFKAAGDFELQIRCAAHGLAPVQIAEPLSLYYQNQKGLTFNDGTSASEAGEVIRRWRETFPIARIYDVAGGGRAEVAAWIDLGHRSLRSGAPWSPNLPHPHFAIACFERALRLDPSCEHALQCLKELERILVRSPSDQLSRAISEVWPLGRGAPRPPAPPPAVPILGWPLATSARTSVAGRASAADARPIAALTESGSGSSGPVVRWAGPVFNFSGYGRLAREALAACMDLGVNVSCDPQLNDPDYFASLSGDSEKITRWKALLSKVGEPGTLIVCDMPRDASGTDVLGSLVRQNTGNSRLVCWTMFETDRLPRGWADSLNLMDEVWVPSEFNFRTFAAAGVDASKIHVVPGGIEAAPYVGAKPIELPGPRRGTTFLSVFQWVRRKGWDVLLRAWANAFDSDADVRLVLRCHPFGKTASEMRGVLQDSLRELGLTESGMAPIVLLDGFLSDADMARLYAASDVFVLPSRGEGWGLPYLEALAAGKPCIATAWGASMDFLSEECAWLVPPRELVPVGAAACRENPYLSADHRWADPDPVDVAKVLRMAAGDAESLRRKSANALQIASRWSHHRTARAIGDRLEAGLRQGAPSTSPVASVSSSRRLSGALAKVARGLIQARPHPIPAVEASVHGAARATLSIRWEGSQLVHHSLAHVNRELCVGLARRGHDLSIIPYEPDQFAAGDDPDLRIVEQLTNAPLEGTCQIHVRHQWPPNLVPPKEGRWVVAQPWEFGSPPKAWMRAFRDQVDELWAYTTYVRDMYVRAGVPADRVHVLPLGVDCDKFRPGLAPLASLPPKKGVRFLYVGGSIARKGFDVLLNAWQKAFGPDDPVELLIKDMGGKTSYKGQTGERFVRRIQESGRFAPVHYVDDDLAPSDLPALYASGDVLVHPYRGEGFGLPIAEAMACGLPVVITAGGAADDFCGSEEGWMIPAERALLPGGKVDDLETVEPAWWLEPSEEALVAALRAAASDSVARREKGEAARRRIAEHFTWEQAVERAQERLRAVAERPIRRFEKTSPRDSVPLASLDVHASEDRPGRVGSKDELDELGRHLFQVEALVSRQELEGAEILTRKVVEDYPSQPMAWLSRAMVLRGLKKGGKAMEALDKALELGGGPDVRYEMLALHLQQGKEGAARVQWNILREKHPSWVEAQRKMHLEQGLPWLPDRLKGASKGKGIKAKKK